MSRWTFAQGYTCLSLGRRAGQFAGRDVTQEKTSAQGNLGAGEGVGVLWGSDPGLAVGRPPGHAALGSSLETAAHCLFPEEKHFLEFDTS